MTPSSREEEIGDLKVKNFHCSEHGDLKPIPKCPKCLIRKMDFEEEFDRQFPENQPVGKRWHEEIKYFIRDLLSHERKEWREKIQQLNMKFNPYDAREVLFHDPSAVEGYNVAVKDAVALLDKDK